MHRADTSWEFRRQFKDPQKKSEWQCQVVLSDLIAHRLHFRLRDTKLLLKCFADSGEV